MMKFLWSILLLTSAVFGVLGPIFFGHALVESESKYFGLAGVCLLIAAVLFFLTKKLAPADA